MINDFLRGLSDAAINSGFSEQAKNELVQKYERRYSLALEAGFTEKEAIDKFGNPEQIVKKLREKKSDNGFACGEQSASNSGNSGEGSNGGDSRDGENAQGASEQGAGEQGENEQTEGDFSDCLDDFIINVYDSDVFVIATDKPGVSVKIAGNVDYESYDDKKEFSFIETPPSKKHRFFGGSREGEIYVYVNKDLRFNKIEFSAGGSGDITVKNLNLKAKSFKLSIVSGDFSGGSADVFVEDGAAISTVSGDARIGKLSARSLNVSTVSGDVIINDALVKTAKMSSVSGDVIIDGSVYSYKSSSISGDVIVNDKKACETVNEIVKRSLKDATKSLNNLGDDLKACFYGDENDDD